MSENAGLSTGEELMVAVHPNGPVNNGSVTGEQYLQAVLVISYQKLQGSDLRQLYCGCAL